MKKSEALLHEMYDEMLDACHEAVKIGNLTYSPAQVLKEVDPIAYRCGFADFLDEIGIEDY